MLRVADAASELIQRIAGHRGPQLLLIDRGVQLLNVLSRLHLASYNRLTPRDPRLDHGFPKPDEADEIMYLGHYTSPHNA